MCKLIPVNGSCIGLQRALPMALPTPEEQLFTLSSVSAIGHRTVTVLLRERVGRSGPTVSGDRSTTYHLTSEPLQARHMPPRQFYVS